MIDQLSGSLQRALERVPYHMHEGVAMYVLHGCPPGNFLRAVLENKLMEAGLRADPQNRVSLSGWVAVLEAMPMDIIGSPLAVSAHIEAKEREREAADV